MIWSTITQKDLELTTDKNELPYQYSNDITLKFMKDTKYNGYAVIPYVGVCDTELISCVDKFKRLQALTMEVDGTFKVSNKVMFNSGYLYVAFDLVSPDEIIHVGNVIYKINASIGDATVLPEDDLTWQEVVKSFMEEYERINFTEKINALISTAEEQQKTVATLQASVNSSIKTLNTLIDNVQTKLSNGDFIPNITLGNVSVGVPGVSFRGTGKDVIVDFTMPEFAGIEEYDKVIRDYIFEVGTDYYVKVESDDYSGNTYDSGADLLKIDGAYGQESTNGYQLFNASRLPTVTRVGVTVTNNGDGSFTFSGSGNLSENFGYSYRHTHTETLKMLKAGKITLNQNGDTVPYALAQLVKSSGTATWFQLHRSNPTVDITQEMLNDSGCYLQMYLIGESGSAIKPGTIKPMLYQDGDGTWESFTNGIPSPNPEYPQEPMFVGDLSKNLLDPSTLIDGYVDNVNGDIVSKGGVYRTFKMDLKAGTYTFSMDKQFNAIRMVKDGVHSNPSLTNLNSYTVKLDNDGMFMFSFRRSDNLALDGDEKIQFERCSIATNYYPFSKESKYYIDFETVGKNLYNKDTVIDGKTVINTGITTNSSYKMSDFIKVEPNTKYYFMNSYASSQWYAGGFFTKNKTFISSFSISGSKTPVNGAITTPDNCHYIVLNIPKIESDQMFSLGSTIQEYEPFKRSERLIPLTEPLRALPNGVKDTIENGSITRRVGKYIVNSINSLLTHTNERGNRKYFVVTISNKKMEDSGVNGFLCDKAQTVINVIDNCIYQNQGNFVITGTVDDTLDSFSEKFLGTTVYYEMATPIIEPIILPTLPTYYPYTNIWQNQEVKANALYGIRSNSNIGMDIVDKAIDDAINKAMQDIITNAELIEVLKNYLPLKGGNITGALTINNNVAINGRDTSNVIRSLAKITAEDITALGSIHLPLQLYGNIAPVWNNGSIKKTIATIDDIPPIKKVTTTVNVHSEMDPKLLEVSLPTGYTIANTTIVAFNEYSNNIKSIPIYSTASLTANNKIQINYIYMGSDTKTVTLEITVMKNA